VDYFVDGVTESLTTDLSRMSGMLVIGCNTAFTYKGKHVDLKQIGHELSVRYVLEGSVQRGGNRMHLGAALAHLNQLDEAQSSARTGLGLTPTFTPGRVRAGAYSDNPIYLAQRERLIEGLRKAGVPE